MTSERTPTLEEVVRDAITARLAEVNVALPGKVVKYYADTRTCDVEPLVSKVYQDPNGGREVLAPQLIRGCPIAGFGTPKYTFTFDLRPDDEVLIVFCQQDIEGWQVTGDADEPVDPRRHSVNDAVVIPGLFSKPNAESAQTPPSDGFVIGVDGDSGQVTFSGDSVHFGSGSATADKALAMAQKVKDELDALKAHFDAVEAVFTGTVINEPGQGSPSALQTAVKLAIGTNPYPTPNSVASELVTSEK